MAGGAGLPCWIIRGLMVAGLCVLAQAAKPDPPGPPTASQPVAERPQSRPRPRPAWLGRKDLRCTADGTHCIALANYIPDVCRTIETVAQEAGLDTGFFARLIWRESLYDATAVSHAGAQGIAQFMPGTAQRRGLADPFNPAEALRASAVYLAELRDIYGNLGFAAAAYNAGEARLEDFLQRDRRLPPETRAYVPAITGYSAIEWRDAPPETPDFGLEEDRPFRPSCEDLARNRTLKEFRTPSSKMPWAVIVAAHRSRDITAHRYQRARGKSADLQGQEVSYIRMRLPARHGTQWTAQIGAESRKAADRICWQLRKSGVGCVVLRN
ncbi:lytic transglycosylase domain-containing protein [Tropicimonas sp. TH_r6]|uniref:lytic transglycosylase domain-containing protein n=1 Tax=Tropicimonas sp. TH_r6 TaxID=3082085 RepID=UPI002953FE90|nr:lytic transglycosylase domain-containing protein [Tropicimonas sp. TH_r6]MDV7142398.1 lytic transglycosylase domain-containing protein [Tropicimonas sp. TH_r6]